MRLCVLAERGTKNLKRKHQALGSVLTYISWTKSISRVLYSTVIYLCLVSPQGSAFLRATHGNGKSLIGQIKFPYAVLLQIGFTPTLCYHKVSWALTSRFHPYLFRGGNFLLHFPGSHLRLTLSATLPCEARTFLTLIPFGPIARNRPT